MEKIKTYPVAVRIVIGKLTEAGYSAYMVGGCVRDSILGREPHDWDVTTSATPEEVLKTFEAFRTVPTGIKHGTVTVLIDSLAVEVTTYRIESAYSDSRHPDSVTFTDEIARDLARRDFTVNAMAYNETSGFVDPHGGRADLEARVIRAVGDPVERFSEDALRILRAVRFASQLKFTLDPATEAALSSCREGLAHISAERIREELVKTLVCPDATRGMELCRRAGLLAYLFPGIGEYAEKLQFRALGFLPIEPEMRLAYLYRQLPPELSDKMLTYLKPSNAFATAVRTLRDATLTDAFDGEIPVSEDGYPVISRYHARLFASKYGDLAPYALTLIAFDAEDGWVPEATELLEVYRADAVAEGDCLKKEQLAVTGSDLIAAGFPPSPALGELLDKLFCEVLRFPEKNDAETLIKLAKEWRDRQ